VAQLLSVEIQRGQLGQLIGDIDEVYPNLCRLSVLNIHGRLFAAGISGKRAYKHL